MFDSCPFPIPAEDGFSHYSLTVHGCRIAFLYWPLLESARPVKFLWKLEQVGQGPASERAGWAELTLREGVSKLLGLFFSLAFLQPQSLINLPQVVWSSQGLLPREAFVD